MRIATITNWAYGATVALTMAAGVTMLMASNADQKEHSAVEQRAAFDHLSEDLETDTYELTDQARLFVVSEDPSHAIVYQHTLANLGTVEQRTAKLHDAGASETELKSLKDGLRWADSLQDEQQAAIQAVKDQHADMARKIVFGPEYERDMERVGFFIQRFQYMLDQRTERAVDDAKAASRNLRHISEIMVGITALLFLFVLAFVLKRRILKPVVRLSDVINRLAAQDYAVETPPYGHVDEIGDMTQAIRVFRENGLERQRLERERDVDRNIRDLLARMTQRLQGCETVSDLAAVVRLFAPLIAPKLAGRLYIQQVQAGRMVCAADWLSPQGDVPEFDADDCWALRRGQLHRPGGSMVDVPCKHVAEGASLNAICVPLTAQGETIGLLCLEPVQGASQADEPAQVYLELMAETVSLALANLKLRDALEEKALFDPLTGLRNRHQLDETVRRQLAQAERTDQPLSYLMIDIDHFKRLNDEYGHEAGDQVIRAVGKIVAGSARDDGLAFRYGGEEFLLMLPGVDQDRAVQRAQQLSARIKDLSVDHEGRTLRGITVSVGVACFPGHGPGHALIRIADAALLRAKHEGRDRVVVPDGREGG